MGKKIFVNKNGLFTPIPPKKLGSLGMSETMSFLNICGLEACRFMSFLGKNHVGPKIWIWSHCWTSTTKLNHFFGVDSLLNF